MISLCFPTRQRPNGVTRMLRSVARTADNVKDLEFIAYVDDDDHSYDAYKPLLPVTWVRGPRIVMSDMWNKCAEASHGDILMIASDDIKFSDRHWDTKVKNAMAQYPDGVAVVYGHDGCFRGETHGTHPFVTRRWMETVGYFVPPYFSCDWIDEWVEDVARQLGRYVYVPDMLIEHMHPWFKKSPVDDNFNEKLARDSRDNNPALFHSDAMIAERHEQVEKLRQLLG